MFRKSASPLPEWSRKILAFRHALKLTQGELGKRLKASAMAVPDGSAEASSLPRTHTFGWAISRTIRSVGSFGDAQVLALRT